MRIEFGHRSNPVFLLLVLAIAQTAHSAIRDDGRLFRPETVQQADATLRKISRRHGKDVVVETFATIPANMQSRLAGMDRAQFFREWAQTRARSLSVNGVYILLVQTPGRMEWQVDEATKRAAFTESDGRRLTEAMIPSLRSEDYDAAVLAGVQFIQTRMRENQADSGGAAGGGSVNPLPGPGDARPIPPPNRQPERPSQPGQPEATPTIGLCGAGMGKWICIGAAALIIMSLVRGMRRARSGGGLRQSPSGRSGMPPYGGSRPPYGGTQPSGGQGGGFGRGIFGGVLGGLFGSWLGGKMAGGSPSRDAGESGGGFLDNLGGSPGGTDFTGPSGPSDGGTSYRGGGSDYSGGGADFGGGGDSGGSDSGGGDSGSAGGGADF